MGKSKHQKQRAEARKKNVASSMKRYVHELTRVQKGILGGIAAVVIVCIITLILLFGTSIPQNNLTALTIGEENISIPEYNFNYFSNVNTFANNYGSYLSSIGLDLSKPLDQQQSYFSQGETWAAYFRSQTQKSLQNTIALAKEAKAAGTVLTDEDKTNIDSFISSIEKQSKDSGKSVDSFLKKVYGKGVTLDVVRQSLERAYLANRQSTVKTESFTYKDSEITDAYNKNKNDFDVATYRLFSIANGADAATKAAAKETADAMLKEITDEASFNDLAKKYAPESDKTKYEDKNASLVSDSPKSSVTDTKVGDWLFAADRKAGDKTVIATDTNQYVVYFISRTRNDYNVVNARHILIQPEISAEASESTAEQKAAAKAEAEKIYGEWKNGEATEDSFAKLAKEKSADTGSASKGGLYENVYKGQMDTAFNDWCFDPARKAGDTGIVETSYGYHIMYYVSTGKPYWQVQVNNKLVSDAYQKYTSDLLAKYPVKAHSFALIFAE